MLLQGLLNSLDFIINTASGDIPFDQYLPLLKTGGVLSLVGFPSEVKFLPYNLNLGMFSRFNPLSVSSVKTPHSLHFVGIV